MIGPGRGFTVTCLETGAQPALVYVIRTVPGPTPVTMPEDKATVAVSIFPEVHAPPPTEFVSVTVAPWQTVAGPPIVADGGAFTLTVVTAKHEPADVKV